MLTTGAGFDATTTVLLVGEEATLAPKGRQLDKDAGGAGMAIGQAIRNRLEPEAFRRWFFVAMVGLGVTMIVRAWGH